MNLPLVRMPNKTIRRRNNLIPSDSILSKIYGGQYEPSTSIRSHAPQLRRVRNIMINFNFEHRSMQPLISTILLCLITVSADAATWYVDSTAIGANKGSS